MKNGRSGLSEGIPLNSKRQKIDDEWVIRQWISDLDSYLEVVEDPTSHTDQFEQLLYLVLDNCIRRSR
jgi:hypothetical protein